MNQTTIIDYGSGNLHSIAKALENVADKNTKIVVSDDINELKKAGRIVLPGVGAFGDCVRGLESVPGIKEELQELVIGQKKPFLGICVGMQMLADEGIEHGSHKGFGWIGGAVVPVVPEEKSLKVPHMGWNELEILEEHPAFEGIKTGDHVYFVHSFHMKCRNKQDVIATTDYSIPLTAAVARGNIVAVQFHPEKSQTVGLKVLSNFLNI